MSTNSSDKPDRLSLLRAKYVQAIREKKAELEALQVKVGLIDELEVESSTLKSSSASSNLGRYSSMSLTEATYDSVKELGKASTVAQVKKHLLSNGFAPKGKNFAITLSMTLKRLHKQKKLMTDLQKGKRLYWRESDVVTLFPNVASN